MFNWNIIIILIVLKVLSIIFAHYYTNSEENKSKRNIVQNIKNKYQEYGESESITEIKSENKICMSLPMRNFTLCWIKFTIDIVDYSKAIIKNLPNLNNYYKNLEKTKKELFTLFSTMNKDINLTDKFKDIINQQIFFKLNLCYAIKNEDQMNILLNSSLLMKNSHELGILFSKIKTNKQNELELKESLTAHTNLYVKSVSVMKKTTDTELTRELVLGSIETVKLLF